MRASPFSRPLFLLLALIALGPLTANGQGNSAGASACQQGGYAALNGLARDGDQVVEVTFRNAGDCVSFAAQGGVIVPARVGGEYRNVACLYARVSNDLWSLDLGVCDLSGLDKSGADFSGSNLTGTTFAGTRLVGADFSWANLDGVDLSTAIVYDYRLTTTTDFSYATLVGADLSGQTWWFADFRGADLSGADLSYAYLMLVYLPDATLTGANLTEVVWSTVWCPDGSWAADYEERTCIGHGIMAHRRPIVPRGGDAP